jgi:hypothetical protein
MPKNTVIAGDYKDKFILNTFGSITINTMFKTLVEINKNTVESYEVVDETSRKSATSAVGRGLVGSIVLGPVGLLAGLSAKSKGTHIVAIQFSDGKKSLLELDDKVYTALVKKLF